MIRLRNALVALATCLLSVGALAQTGKGFTQESESVTVAEELFGGGAVELDFARFEDASTPFVPKAKLIFSGGTSLSRETEFDVTFTLSGNNKFAERVSNNDFMWGSWGPDLDGADDEVGDFTATGTDDASVLSRKQAEDNCQIAFVERAGEVEVEREGGASGSNSVTFSVKVRAETQIAGDGTVTFDATQDIEGLAAPVMSDGNTLQPSDCTVSTADPAPEGLVSGYVAGSTTRKIVFILPDIDAVGLKAPVDGKGAVNVMVTTRIEQTRSGGAGDKISEPILMGYKCGGDDPDDFDADDQVSCPVVKAYKIVTGISNSGGSGSISLDPDDDREVLVTPGSDNKALTKQQIVLSTIKLSADFSRTVYNAEGEKIEAGEDPKDNLTGDLDGNLVISVSSDSFNEGDVVYIDDDGDGNIDAREEFSMDDGVAETDVDLSTASLTVWYAPSGDAPMEHETEFLINAHTDYSETSNRMTSAKEAMATLRLNGIKRNAALAYAIARPMEMDDTDTTNVRVTCETSADTGCNVFFQCRDQAPADEDLVDEFGEDGMEIGPDRTMRFSQDDIADMLGIDTWTGRLSCEVLSTDKISVQVLTRSHGVLVNNTPVNIGGTNTVRAE